MSRARICPGGAGAAIPPQLSRGGKRRRPSGEAPPRPPEPSWSRGPVVRQPRDAALAGAGVVLLLLSAVPVDPNVVASPERTVFRLVNDHTVVPFAAVWAVMQLGNILTVPAAAAAAAVARRWRLAVGLLVGGAGTYVLAKVVKGLVVRGRPDSLLEDVQIRGTASLGRGYVSGHAAVITLLAVLGWPYLGRRMRVLVLTTAVLVGLSRVYVGAHLPLDVVGGAALGLAVGGVVRLALGRPSRRPQVSR